MTEVCEQHGTPLRVERMTRSDGTEIGNLTLTVCSQCEDGADADCDAFLARVREDDL